MVVPFNVGVSPHGGPIHCWRVYTEGCNVGCLTGVNFDLHGQVQVSCVLLL